MKKLFVVFLFASCNSKPSFESRIQSYMKDSVVVNFNDPKSYEYVSMQADTVTGKDYDTSMVEMYNRYINDIYQTQTKMIENDFSSDTMGMYSVLKPGNETIDKFENDIKKIRTKPSPPDSIYNINVIVKFRGKNKIGALILDETRLKYFPKEDKIVPFDNLK